MSVTQIHNTDQQLTAARQNLASAESEARRARLNDAWQFAGRTGIHELRELLPKALDGLNEALERQRNARLAVEDIEAIHRDIVATLSWEISGSIEREGAKTFVVVPAAKSEEAPTRRQVSADEAREWVAAEVARHPEATSAAADLASVRANLAEATDLAKIAAERVSVTRHALDAAAATVGLLTAAYGDAS